MKTKIEFLAQQAEELAKFEKEQVIRALLPEAYRDSASICIHSDHASVAMWPGFRTGRKLAEAVEVVNHFAPQIQTCEHWKNGCVSTRPPQLNEYAKNESSTMDGSHFVEIVVAGGNGFGPDVEVRFWVETGAGMLEISCPVGDLFKLTPKVEAEYTRQGNLSSCRINWPVESRCVDSFRNWWSEKPAYRGSYYLADLPNFLSWAGSILSAKEAQLA